GLGQLVRADARGLVVVLHVVILELALARLIANRAVHRVIDEVELHAPALALLHGGGIGGDLQTFLDADLAAGNDPAGRAARADRGGLHARGLWSASSGVAHCSTSPPIMLIESKMGMMSATMCPLMRRGSPDKMGNPGARTWMVYGFPFPFDTMWKPSSPL